jgi:hypothetical protein
VRHNDIPAAILFQVTSTGGPGRWSRFHAIANQVRQILDHEWLLNEQVAAPPAQFLLVGRKLASRHNDDL